jgi:alpha-2-macroglobulin
LVRRYYELAPIQKDGRIVYRETPFGGSASPGDLLLVRLTAAGSNDWRYLMVEDPLPAGVEPVQQRDLYTLERRQSFWDGSRREYRDDRVVFFQQAFGDGRYEYVYLLKVTTPGTFRAMPARIAAMYVADASASSDSQTLVVGAEPPRATGPTK